MYDHVVGLDRIVPYGPMVYDTDMHDELFAVRLVSRLSLFVVVLSYRSVPGASYELLVEVLVLLNFTACCLIYGYAVRVRMRKKSTVVK